MLACNSSLVSAETRPISTICSLLEHSHQANIVTDFVRMRNICTLRSWHADWYSVRFQ